MATSNTFGFSLNEYMNVRTLTVATLVPFLAAVALLYGVMDPVSFVTGHTFGPEHALLVSVGALAIALITSRTRGWEQYSNVEKGVVGGAATSMVAHEYDVMGYAGTIDGMTHWVLFALTLLGLLAWLIVSR